MIYLRKYKNNRTGCSQWIRLLLLYILVLKTTADFDNRTDDHVLLSRQKRLAFFTSDRRFALPPGSVLSLSLKLSIPLQRGMPNGYKSGTNLELPFIMDLDKLAWTSDENPFLSLPFGEERRKKRQIKYIGDRILLYRLLEDFLTNMGMNGQACLLRAICETHELPFFAHGFFGEVLRMLLTASLAYDLPETLDLYLEAEKMGADYSNCKKFTALCSHTLYSTRKKYPERQGAQGRFLHFTSDRRITMPFGTVGVAYISLGINNFRGAQYGTSVSMSITTVLQMDFNTLGWASEENPFFNVSPLGLGEPPADPVDPPRKKREEPNDHLLFDKGGDRKVMYAALEQYLTTFDLDGHACLLRAICELQEKPVSNYSFIGEVLAIFLKPSRSPSPEDRLGDYLRAERQGRRTGDCSSYRKGCQQSFFVDGPRKERESEVEDNPQSILEDSDLNFM